MSTRSERRAEERKRVKDARKAQLNPTAVAAVAESAEPNLEPERISLRIRGPNFTVGCVAGTVPVGCAAGTLP